jgi:hypothetical protein
MLHTLDPLEQDPATQDEFDRLERIHQRMKNEQEAWRKLLESLEKSRQKRIDTETDVKPSK